MMGEDNPLLIWTPPLGSDQDDFYLAGLHQGTELVDRLIETDSPNEIDGVLDCIHEFGGNPYEYLEEIDRQLLIRGWV